LFSDGMPPDPFDVPLVDEALLAELALTVELIIKASDWGTDRLPQHQIDRILLSRHQDDPHDQPQR
jgi:hypothetical protein